MIQWHIEKRKLSDLKNHPSNPRTLTKKQRDHIKQSLMKFGVIDKLVVNQDNTILGGHQRARILKEMGQSEVECYIPSRLLTPEEQQELLVRLNKNTGDFDFDLLANQFNPLDLLNWGFGLEELELIEPKEPKKKKPKLCPHCGVEI